MKALLLRGNLLPVTTLDQAEKILQEAQKQKISISFKKENEPVVFEPITNDEFVFFAPNLKISTPVELQPSVRVSKNNATKKLYKYRKYFNHKYS